MREGDTATFNAATYDKTVREMKSRGESVHARAEETVRITGKLDPNVWVYKNDQGPVRRTSRNAFTKNPNGTCTLTRGIKLPVVTSTDGTGSMGENVAKAFQSMKRLFDMLGKLGIRYQLDLSEAVMQDVCDSHGVFQMAQFESGNMAAEHVRQLFPDKFGGDGTEDYDLGLYYLDQGVDTDIVQYGLKGYIINIADADGRGFVSPEDVKRYFGFDLQNRQSTRDICKRLLKKWHVYLIQVEGGHTCTTWWSEQLGGDDRIVKIDDADLLAEVEAGLIYVTETLQPSKDGLKDFLSAESTNNQISDYDINRVWDWLQSVRKHFGEQAKLAGYDDIPLPGDVFTNYRDPWPIDHHRAGENPSAGGSPATTSSATPAEEIPWRNL